MSNSEDCMPDDEDHYFYDDIAEVPPLEDDFAFNDDDDGLPPTQIITQEQLENNTYEYEGIKVNFPYQAYESQQAMMEKIIKGVNSKSHCLLESPTGTGKTAAIICSLLAWQEHEAEQCLALQRQEQQAQRHKASTSSTYLSPKKFKIDLNSPVKKQNHHHDDTTVLCESSETTPTKNTTYTIGNISNSSANNNSLFETSSTSSTSNQTTLNLGHSSCMNDSQSLHSIPIIYYATRTHSQIKQVVAQLKATAYSTTPMSLLSSRVQSCVNAVAQSGVYPSDPPKYLNIDEICEKFRTNVDHNSKLKEGEKPLPTCKYYGDEEENKIMASTFSEFVAQRAGEVWDIEDIRQYATNCNKCAYYGAKKLAENARIIFCTYNHLLHNQIRKASKIDVKDNIIVFDESHNLEDLCREIASIKLNVSSLDQAILDLDKAYNRNEVPVIKKEPLTNLWIAFTKLKNWLHTQAEERENPKDKVGFKAIFDNDGENEKYFKDLSKLEGGVAETFERVGFGPGDIKSLWSDFFILEDRHYDIKSDAIDRAFKVERRAMKQIAGLLYALNCLYKKNENGDLYRLRDYEVLLVKTIKSYRVASNQPSTSKSSVTLELQILCLNPGIAFEKMKEARTVIVTSGTLSPIMSFASELDCEFKQELSASHVLGKDRIFASIVNSYQSGPDLHPLNFSQASLKKNYHQHLNDLGRIIIEICQTVPFGILVFTPSKILTERLRTTWENSDVISRINMYKDVYFENDAKTPETFLEMMRKYRESLNPHTPNSKKGAIMFAILRGKVSEGVDFKDNQARAVITIGIPYAPVKEFSVSAKMKYNELRKQDLLNGRKWYDANAFRALNQAFGRCVRHQFDWGAIIIIDARFTTPDKKVLLSKWVRDCIDTETVGSFVTILPGLKNFVRQLSLDFEVKI